MEPLFLSLNDMIAIHRDQIRRYGGESGIRDAGLLDSAVKSPAAGHAGGYFHSDVFEMAAAYLYHIIQNHPFVDGNKRSGAVASIIFLAFNGVSFDAAERDLEEVVLAVASGEKGKEEVAEFFRRYSVKHK